MSERRRVGRPTIAAQTMDEALRMAYAGELPKRPRNSVERKVMRKKQGRSPTPGAKTHAAVQLAKYLIDSDEKGEREACREAAGVYKLHPDTVRKALRKVIRPKTVDVHVKQNPMFQHLAGGAVVVVAVPFVPDSSDLPHEWQ